MSTPFKLSTRILLGYLVPCIVFTLAALAVYHQSLRLGQMIAEARRVNIIVDQSMILRLAVAQMQRTTRGLMLHFDEAELQDFETSRQQADDALATLRRLAQDAGQRDALERASTLLAGQVEVTRRLIELSRSARVEEAIQLYRAGETSEQYRAFNTLFDRFFEREQEILAALDARSQGDLQLVQHLSWIGVLLALVISMVAGLWLARKTTHQLRELIGVIAASTTQIAATTQQHEGAMTQQASAVTETTATVEEMVATARINAEQAESATRAANETQATTQEGLQLVTHNEADMGAMAESMNRIAQQIIGLSEQAGQIGEIARVVGELAAETNILALNAAVEAARAGEQGRGFAVVASEIRKLADQSRKSAERANQIVADIQKVTNGMVMTAEDGSKTTHVAAESAQLASQAFEKVMQLAGAVVQNAQQVLLNSKQQAVALSQIDIAMKNINHGAREMSTGTAQIRDGMARLSQVAGELNQML